MSIKNITDSKVEKKLILASKKIRAERIALDLTQEEFANFTDIKYSTYKNFEQRGRISFENYIKILININKMEQFEKFLDGFEFNEQKERIAKNIENNEFLKPIIKAEQKRISLDKNIFGAELFYSVENGHMYDVPTFINIVLQKWNDKRVMLLIKYFGEERLKSIIIKQKDIRLLKTFNKHIQYISKGH